VRITPSRLPNRASDSQNQPRENVAVSIFAGTGVSIIGLAGVTLVPNIAVPAPVPAMIKAMEMKNIILITLLAITSTLPTPKYNRDYLRVKLAAQGWV
jgi:hypothetical protein